VNDMTSGRRTIHQDGVDIILFPEREDIHADLAPLHDYWRDQCGGALPIPRTMVDATQLPPKLLPRFAIIEILREPLDFRYRLLGTSLTQFFGRDSTGKRFSELGYPQPQGDGLHRYFALVANDGLVVYRETTAAWANRDYISIASMFLPGTSDGTSADLIFGAFVTVR
jgi:hypothetical protein